MPELPEVETIRRELERDIVGLRVKDVEVNDTRSIRRHGKKAPFVKLLDGAKVTQVNRRGKYLVVNLDTGSVLVIHLGMSGQLRRNAAKDATETHTRVVLTFTQKGQLRFIDPRKFGEMFVVDADAVDDEVPELAAPRLRPRRAGRVVDHFGQAAAQPQREAEVAADGPEVHRRHRQHLLRRDPLTAPASATTDCPTRCRPRRSAGSTGRWSRPSTTPSSTAARRCPTASTSTSTASPASTRNTTRSTTARARPAAVAGPPSSVKANQRSTFFCEQCQV